MNITLYLYFQSFDIIQSKTQKKLGTSPFIPSSSKTMLFSIVLFPIQ